MLIWMLGCSMSSPSTLVDELRVMAIQTEPAEMSPLDTEGILRLLIADPLSKGADVLYWTCTNFGDGCLEEQFFAQDMTQWPQYFSREDLISERSLSIPTGLAGVVDTLPEESIPFSGTLLWVLACIPNECSFMSDIQEGIVDAELLASPFDIIEDIPFGVSSLSFKSIPISNRPIEERVQNPEVRPLFEEKPTQEAEETIDLEFSYNLNGLPNEDALIYGYATIGGFPEADRSNSQLQETEGSVILSWSAPEEEGEGSLYVILENGSGGTGIWYSDALVTAVP
jgi:hypothetical protein